MCGGERSFSSVEDKKLKSKEERSKVEYDTMDSWALEKSSEPEEKSKYELVGSCGQQRFLHETEGAKFVFPPDMVAPERPRGDGVTYINIPISPMSKKQLNYMELEHQEHAGVRGTGQHLPGQIGDCSRSFRVTTEPPSSAWSNRQKSQPLTSLLSGNMRDSLGQREKGKSSSKYALIDITATDAAHKTGTQHALGREEGLHTLEQRRRVVPQ